MERPQKFPADRLIVFGRYPVPGRTKTRLIPVLGPTGAAELHRILTENTLKTVKAFTESHWISYEVCFEGGSVDKMLRWLGSGIHFSKQHKGDLGRRMQFAFADAFRNGFKRVVLVGTDIPELRKDHLKSAFDALSDHDIVLGPSTDGGYWLIGLRGQVDVFRGIDWGTKEVLEQTLDLAKQQGRKICLLDPLDDLDTTDDLKVLNSDILPSGPYLSVIVPALNEAKNIETAVQRAGNPDAEVIVVDGGSIDDTAPKAQHAGARVVKSPCGRARQQNFGAKSALGKVFLFLHADTVLPAGYVNDVFETLMDPRAVLGAFRFKTDLKHPLMKVLEFLTNFRSRYLKLPYGDQCLFMRRSVFESVGGFPEVSIAEDLYLVRRLSRLGGILISPSYAVTSGRRWQTVGLLRTTMINQIILAGIALGIVPHVLASLYPVSRRH